MVEPVSSLRSVPLGPPGADAGQRIVESAWAIARERGGSYARARAPVSPEPRLTGNHLPGATPLRWLRGENKCNQFVGDALYGAGLHMPLFRMADGSHHYMHAAALPGQRGFFARVTSRADILPGDILVIRQPGRGENSAHVEIITNVNRASGALTTLGAHPRGIEERQRVLGKGASVDEAWPKGNDRWFVLRPYATVSSED